MGSIVNLRDFWKTKGDIIVYCIGHLLGAWLTNKVYSSSPHLFKANTIDAALTGVYWFYAFLGGLMTAVLTYATNVARDTSGFNANEMVWRYVVVHISSYCLMHYIWISNWSWVSTFNVPDENGDDDYDDDHDDGFSEDDEYAHVIEATRKSVNLMLHVMNAVACGLYIILNGTTFDAMIKKIILE